MKILLTLILILGLGAGAWVFYGKWNAGTAEDNTQLVLPSAQAEERNIRFAVSAAGEIGPAEQVSVRPEINGRIETLPVDLGDKVLKGEVLFTLDDREYKNQRDSSQTAIDRAQLQLSQTERNYKRAQQLFKDELISQEEYENFKTEMDLAKNALEQSRKELAVIEERLTKTKILAPFDCTVLARPVSIGQAVSGSGGVGGGTEVLAIADLNEMIIQAHINQADVTMLKVDQEVDVQVEAVTGLTVRGIVERIAPQATIRNNIKGFLARILLRQVDPRIRPGMTANINIPVATADNVITVPLSAVFTEYNQKTRRTERYAYVKTGDQSWEQRFLEIGLADFFHVEIRKGLEPGEVVCLQQPPADQITQPEEPAPEPTGQPSGKSQSKTPQGARKTASRS